MHRKPSVFWGISENCSAPQPLAARMHDREHARPRARTLIHTASARVCSHGVLPRLLGVDLDFPRELITKCDSLAAQGIRQA